MSTIKKLEGKSAQTSFDKKVLSAIPHLQPYVKHRLYVAESKGIVPKNMYHSNGIIDDSIVQLYEQGFDVDEERMAVKLNLFELVDHKLDALFKDEAFHKNTISTNSILSDELDALEEIFTVDAGNDLVMNEELDDISYHQGDFKKHIFLYDSNESDILNAFEMENIAAVDTKNLLGKFYSWTPKRAADIVDLYVFGKLSFKEIARVKKIDIDGVEKIFKKIKKGFRSHLE